MLPHLPRCGKVTGRRSNVPLLYTVEVAKSYPIKMRRDAASTRAVSDRVERWLPQESVRPSSSHRPSDGRGAWGEGGRNCQKAIILSPQPPDTARFPKADGPSRGVSRNRNGGGVARSHGRIVTQQGDGYHHNWRFLYSARFQMIPTVTGGGIRVIFTRSQYNPAGFLLLASRRRALHSTRFHATC